MSHDVFISYSSKNKTAADAICHVLEENSIKCWMAPRDIPPGSEYGDMIDDAIKSAKIVVVIFSKTAADSPWVKGELNVAFEEQKTIIPFRLDTTPLKGQNRVMLNQKHWIDAFPDYEEKFADLVSAVLHSLDKTTEKQVEPTNSANKIKTKSRIILIIILLVIIVGSCAVLLALHKKTFSYNRNGLMIESVSNLTNEQCVILESILDNMVLIEGGSFLMGNNYSNPEYLTALDSLSIYPHTVELSNFYISKYEVSQAQWAAFENLDKCYTELDNCKAIENISWEEANHFAERLSKITGLQFSLPTEAQWEYAASEGTHNVGNIFSGCSDGIHHYAWTQSDNLTSAAEVGKRLPNKLGLYDMTGNVGEWCLDDFKLYESKPQTNPIVTGGMYKVYRGGDYNTPNMLDMKTTTRYYAPPFSKRIATGIRLVVNLK
jgi:formylglycine-generating enzyme required for sulfatase activity